MYWIDADELLDRLVALCELDGRPWDPPRPLNYQDAERLATFCGCDHKHQSDGTTLIRIDGEEKHA